MLHVLLTTVLRTVLAVVQVLVLLVAELVTAMLVYIYLNLYHLATFGYLVRLARYVLDVLTGQLDYWLPRSANVVYATLVGELGPKSILLLLIGLLSAFVIRSLARLVRRWLARRQLSSAAGASA
jgi:hypothetical protein